MSKTNKNNHLLVSGDYPLIASPTLAKAFGVAAANFLQKLHYFLENNEGKTFNGKNIGSIVMNSGKARLACTASQQSNELLQS